MEKENGKYIKKQNPIYTGDQFTMKGNKSIRRETTANNGYIYTSVITSS